MGKKLGGMASRRGRREGMLLWDGRERGEGRLDGKGFMGMGRERQGIL